MLDEAALLDVDLLADQGEGPNVSRAVDSEEFVSCKWGNKLLVLVAFGNEFPVSDAENVVQISLV